MNHENVAEKFPAHQGTAMEDLGDFLDWIPRFYALDILHDPETGVINKDGIDHSFDSLVSTFWERSLHETKPRSTEMVKRCRPVFNITQHHTFPRG